MKLISNKGIIFSKNRAKFNDILFESVSEVECYFPACTWHILKRLNKTTELYNDRLETLYGFVEAEGSTRDKPRFIHVITGDGFKVKRELQESDMIGYGF